MATKYLERVGASAGDAANILAQLKTDSAGNVAPLVLDAVDEVLKYYDRTNSVVRQVIPTATAPISATGAALTVTAALHSGRTVLLNRGAGVAVTLPAATGTGNKYRFVVGTASNANTIATAPTTDSFVGGVLINDTGGSTAATADFYPTVAGGSNSNLMSPLTVTGGGLVGDVVEVEDIAAATWATRGVFQGAVDPATPFSHV